ncbi:hypothetical protein RKD23_000262 [Streptomyces sp. SAI-170]|uniref:hypothetical protein n=1 Tax=Streptomyces sp. SAI-170 TaxID=3377729 RepID=UPI003C7B897F
MTYELTGRVGSLRVPVGTAGALAAARASVWRKLRSRGRCICKSVCLLPSPTGIDRRGSGSPLTGGSAAADSSPALLSAAHTP